MIWLLLAVTVVGAQTTQDGDSMACEVIRTYTERYGETVARQYVKDHHWTRERIAAAVKCLKAPRR